jgi:xanthine dehydrogenase accessory factor
MIDWVATLRAALAAEGRAAMVTVAATRGSVPREAGARMIATDRTTYGTIGGGHLEFEAIRIAREGLEAGGAGASLVRFPLAARLGQCCGGVATVLFQRFDVATEPSLAALAQRVERGESVAIATAVRQENAEAIVVTADTAPEALPAPVLAAARALLALPDAAPQLIDGPGATWFVERVVGNNFRVLIFGNGHVGRALVQVLGALPCTVTWVDEREPDFPARPPPNVAVVATDSPEAEVRAAQPGSMYLVMTHSHALDFELVGAILGRDDFRYVGMIGSKAKRAQMERRLAERGVDKASIARVTCPIGIAGIGGREPGAIAVAVAGELLQVRERDAATLDAGQPRERRSCP